MCSVAEKSQVEINHTKKSLKSGFILGRRNISNGRGMLQERAEAGAGEVMTQELSLGNLELTFAQANRQAVDSAFSMAENLALGSANFSGSSLGGLAYTGGPGLVSR